MFEIGAEGQVFSLLNGDNPLHRRFRDHRATAHDPLKQRHDSVIDDHVVGKQTVDPNQTIPDFEKSIGLQF